MTPPKKIPFSSVDFDFDKPPAQVAVKADGTTPVRIKKLTTVTSFLAKIFESNAVPADLSTVPDADKYALNLENGTQYYSADLPVGPVPLAVPAAPNKVVVVWPTGGDVGTLDFKAIASTNYPNVTVTAKQSLWFAYAPAAYAARPHGEVDNVYLPSRLIIPTDATKVTLAVSHNDWGHGDAADPRCTSDAAGTAWSSDLNATYAGEYQTNALNSLKIRGTSLPHNTLVGMWGRLATDDGVAGSQTKLNSEFAVGLGITDRPIATDPARAAMLYLGLHDSYEWTNNWGYVTVTVTWG